MIWLAEVPFRGIPHRQARLAALLSDRFDVLYVEPPPPRRPPSLTLARCDRVAIAQVAPIVNARPPALRRLLSFRSVRALARQAAARQLALAAWRTCRTGERGKTAIVCSNVYLADAATAMHPDALIVDICDDPRHYPDEPTWSHELLVQAVRTADVVTTSSRALEEEMRTLGARQVEYLPNGVFASALESQSTGASKTIGFVGYLGPWIDVRLIAALADALPERQLVLVGPVDTAMAEQFAILERRPNVSLLGSVPETDVPRTIGSFGVGIIPFAVTPYTRAVNPNKLYEYAAQNLPIVATAFSPDVEQFAGAVAVCRTYEAFIDAVEASLTTAPGPGTRWIAESHTWERIADRLAAVVNAAMTYRAARTA